MSRKIKLLVIITENYALNTYSPNVFVDSMLDDMAKAQYCKVFEITEEEKAELNDIRNRHIEKIDSIYHLHSAMIDLTAKLSIIDDILSESQIAIYDNIEGLFKSVTSNTIRALERIRTHEAQ